VTKDRLPENTAGDPASVLIEESLAAVREALTGLRYGAVQLTIHEGRVVQIDVTEKRRLKPT
jgi:hypothetical protein